MTTALTTTEDPQALRELSAYQIKGALFSPTELVIESGLSEREWMRLGAAISRVCSSANWWIGDYIQFGIKTYGISPAYTLAQQVSNYSRTFLYSVAGTARRFAPSERSPKLSFYHYTTARSWPHDLAIKLLAEAEENGWTGRQMLAIARKEYGIQPRPSLYKRKKIVAWVWNETYYQLQEKADGMKLSYFLNQIIEEYLIGKPAERYSASGLTTKTRAWRDSLRKRVLDGVEPDAVVAAAQN